MANPQSAVAVPQWLPRRLRRSPLVKQGAPVHPPLPLLLPLLRLPLLLLPLLRLPLLLLSPLQNPQVLGLLLP